MSQLSHVGGGKGDVTQLWKFVVGKIASIREDHKVVYSQNRENDAEETA